MDQRDQQSHGHLRTGDRLTINQEFESFDAFLQEYVTNISRSGVFVRSKTPLPVGTQVDLHFTVITDDLQTIEGVGEVVRRDAHGMGIVFRELTSESRALVEHLLSAS